MSDENAEALAALDGASESVEAESAPAAGQAETPQAFHTWKSRDGQETVFNTPEELSDYMNQGTLRHADYTKKTQGVAEARKLMDQQRKDYEAKERTFNEAYGPVMSKDKFLRDNPAVAQRIAQEMRGTTQQDNGALERMLDERLKPFEEFQSKYDQDQKQRAGAESRDKAYGIVAEKFPDFDRGQVEEAINKLMEVPEPMLQEALVELVYHAGKGRLTPGEIERKQAMTANKPKATTPTSSVGIPDKQVSAMSREDEMAAALAAMDAAGSG